ncbi:unnamed protein product [Adineta ricciae]|uniref:Tubulin-tyrosine ligase family protein n=1 Tax=Adineta ricciae TaxID=249248 RepID=A0A814XS70_ADIRI|nr:unnamed protein product [Adineta ricciae]
MCLIFENLPDEIILYICQYLRGADVLYSFYNLNIRLNTALTGYCRYVNLMRVAYKKLTYVITHVLPCIGQHVRSFCLNIYWESMIPDQLSQLLYSSRLCEIFPYIENLTVRGFSSERLQVFLDCIENFPRLNNLKIQFLSGSSTGICLTKLFSANQGRLSKVFFDWNSIDLDIPQDTSDISCPNIQELTIPLTSINTLARLCKVISNVHCLYVNLGTFVDIGNCAEAFKDVSPLFRLVDFSIHSIDWFCPFDAFVAMIRKMPSLQKLKFHLCTQEECFLVEENIRINLPISCCQLDYFIDYRLSGMDSEIKNLLTSNRNFSSTVHLLFDETHDTLNVHTVPCRLQSMVLLGSVAKQMMPGSSYTEHVRNLHIYGAQCLNDVFQILQHFRHLNILSIMNNSTTPNKPIVFHLPYLKQLCIDGTCELSNLLDAAPDLYQFNVDFDCVKMFIQNHSRSTRTSVRSIDIFDWTGTHAELLQHITQTFVTLDHLNIHMASRISSMDSFLLECLPVCKSGMRISLGVTGSLSEQVQNNIRQWVIDHSHLSEKDSFAVQYRQNWFQSTLMSQNLLGMASKTAKRRFRKSRRNVPIVDTSQARSNLEVLRMCLNDLGWKECISGNSANLDICWNAAGFHDGSRNYASLSARVNKFPGMSDVLCKSNLTRSLNAMRRLFPDEYKFYPRTWFLPEQREQFQRDANEIHKRDRKRQRPLTTFIVKPSDGSEGAGIYLIQDPTRCSAMNREHIVQEYIDRPLLINGLKFDVRIYVLIRQLDPLEILLYDEGLARFATVEYQAPSIKNLHEAFMHLTNYSLNKRSATYKHAVDVSQADASKRKFSLVWLQLAQSYNPEDIERAKRLIKEMINKTVIAILPELRVQYALEMPTATKQNQCFQIIGFDILLTDRLKPILLEVNSNPSLRIDYDHMNEVGKLVHEPSLIDEEIKRPLVRETLQLALNERPSQRIKNITNHPIESCSTHDSTRIRSDSESSLSNSSVSDSDLSTDTLQESVSESLEVIYPSTPEIDYEQMFLLEKVAFIYIELVLKRGYKALTNRPFRQLASICGIIDQGTPMSAIDILYVQIFSKCKQYASQSPATGLDFSVFIEAFFLLSQRKYPNSSLLESVTQLIDSCIHHLNLKNEL